MQLDYNYPGSKPQLALSLMTGTRVAGDIDSGAGPGASETNGEKKLQPWAWELAVRATAR